MNNHQVQALFDEAYQYVAEDSSDELKQLKIILTRNTLTVLKLYTASSNTIPALGGLGLEEGIKLAQAIIDVEGDLTKFRYNFKALTRFLVV